MKITCSRCGDFLELNRLGLQGYCKSCYNEYSREHKPKYNQLSIEEKKKKICRTYAGRYVRKGKIVKQSCSKCGNPNSEMHHENYDKRLEVIWLCRGCHVDLHTQRNRLSNQKGN